MSAACRDVEVATSKTGRSALTGSDGRFLDRRPTGRPGQLLPPAAGRFLASHSDIVSTLASSVVRILDLHRKF